MPGDRACEKEQEAARAALGALQGGVGVAGEGSAWGNLLACAGAKHQSEIWGAQAAGAHPLPLSALVAQPGAW